MNKKIKWLSIIAGLTTIISALVGLLYSNGGASFVVKSIYGQEIRLFGDGIYAYNTILKVGATKGTDIVMIAIAFVLLMDVIFLSPKRFAKLFAAGLQCSLLYASVCLVMGVSFNRLFPIYLVQFSSSLFAFIYTIFSIKEQDCFCEALYDKKLKGTALFMIIGGCSVLVWLTFIIPAIISGTPKEFIEIYTTEPTFVLDLGIIFPTCLGTGIGLLKKSKFTYAVASVLLTLITCVGLCVIFQTIVQLQLGVVLEIGQMLGLVLSFVILGIIAIILNYRLFRYTKCE